MKLLTIRKLAVILVTLLSLPIACMDDEDDCGNSSSGVFQIKNLDLAAANYYKYESYSNIISPTTEHQDSFALVLKVTEAEQLISELKENDNFYFGNMAFACSILPPIGRSQINALNIIANDTLQTNTRVYLPGESLNSLFNVRNFSSESISIEEFRKRQDAAFNSSVSYSTFGAPNDVIPFVLNDSIHPVQQIEFTLDIVVDNVKSFKLSSRAQNLY